MSKYLLVLLGVALLCGCAETRKEIRSNHIVTKKTTSVVIPASAEMPAQVVPVVEITETWEDEKTHAEMKTTPDVAAVVPIVASIGTAAATGGWGPIAQGTLALLTTAAVGFAAKKMGESKEKDIQIRDHKADADEGWKKALDRGHA